ncbi:MLO-like protein 1 isoform X2 [Aristolochia californica]|uniref:MLO-like protein 1 isoform X2 n=1 Tax=Aristolochia californica TaxID=171875 RepID=UPI0035D60F96
MAGGEDTRPLEYTPTWVVAVVCFVIVSISLAAERTLHFLGKYLWKKNLKALFEALQKLKEGPITRICVPVDLTKHLFPCKKHTQNVKRATFHFQTLIGDGILSSGRHLLAESSSEGHCKEGKVSVITSEALHQLHIFIFVLAITHVVFCLLTIILGGAKIQRWKHWEASIAKDLYDTEQVLKNKVTNVHQHDFIREHFLGFGNSVAILGWLQAFIKQFSASVTKTDYATLRLSFIMTHCRGNPKFDFYKYMMRTLQADFKKVVGISWYFWILVVVFLLLNVHGWHTYFWISFFPLILLFVVGTQLEHIITLLAHDVAEKHAAVEGELVVRPSDDHFWFQRPRVMLHLIHFILFQNAFEIAFFFWILVTYGWDSCIMGQIGFVIPRLMIGVIIQLLCSYSTLPLYAILSQMGSSYKKAIFEEHLQESLIKWAAKARKRNKSKLAIGKEAPSPAGEKSSSPAGEKSPAEIQLQEVEDQDFTMEEGLTARNVSSAASPANNPASNDSA